MPDERAVDEGVYAYAKAVRFVYGWPELRRHFATANQWIRETRYEKIAGREMITSERFKVLSRNVAFLPPYKFPHTDVAEADNSVATCRDVVFRLEFAAKWPITHCAVVSRRETTELRPLPTDRKFEKRLEVDRRKRFRISQPFCEPCMDKVALNSG
jgi:hypothetical protein